MGRGREQQSKVANALATNKRSNVLTFEKKWDQIQNSADPEKTYSDYPYEFEVTINYGYYDEVEVDEVVLHNYILDSLSNNLEEKINNL